MDYGTRMYDPALGRFHTQDVFAEKYLDMTPYQYVANNPIIFIDPDGQEIWIYYNDKDGEQKIQYIPGMEYKGDNTFVKSAVSALNTINSGKYGGSLIFKLHKSTFKVDIYKTDESNKEGSSSDGFISENGEKGKGSDSKILWNPNQTEGPLDQNGETDMPSFIGLSHELGHSKDAIKGTKQKGYDKKGVKWTDVSACDTENKVRAENNIPLRKYYTLVRVQDSHGNFIRWDGKGKLIRGNKNIHNGYNYLKKK